MLPSWFSALGRGGLSGQRGTSLIGRSLVSGVGPGVSWSPPSPSLQEEPTVHSALSEPCEPSEPQDPTGLEKTDVNHNTQAFGGQGDSAQCSNGNEIKTETLEDDWKKRWISKLSQWKRSKGVLICNIFYRNVIIKKEDDQNRVNSNPEIPPNPTSNHQPTLLHSYYTYYYY